MDELYSICIIIVFIFVRHLTIRQIHVVSIPEMLEEDQAKQLTAENNVNSCKERERD